MTPLKQLIAAGLLLSPTLAIADADVFRCQATHLVRAITGAEPDELRFTVLSFNNADLRNEAVIERLTVRDAFGVVRHDSGARASPPMPHPLNLGIQDITTVLPGGTLSFSTTDLWPSGVPPFAVPLTLPQQFVLLGGLSMTVEVSKRGNPALFVVHASERQRVPPLAGGGPAAGAERSAKTARCFRINDRDAS